MKSIEDLYDLVNKSSFTTIGYTSQHESLKDEFISKLPHMVINEEIDSSFSFKSIIRDNKLESLLDNKDLIIPEYFVIDYENVKFPNIDSMARYLRLKETLENLRYVGMENNIKVIFTSPIYRLSEDYTIKGGSSPIYVADLVLMLNGDNCKISKNRFSHGHFDETISLNGL